MKKKLLFFLSVLCFSFASAQIGQPFPILLCGSSDVYFDDETGAILGNLNPNDYTVTYHLSQSDADSDVSALPNPYFFTASQVVFARVEENANQSNFQVVLLEVVVYPLPAAPTISHTYCDNDGVNDGATGVNLEMMIAEIVGGQPNLTVAFYGSQADAELQVNQLPWLYTTTTSPQTLYYTISDWQTGCNSVGSVIIIVADCSASCPAPSNVSATNISNSTFTVGWTDNGPGTSLYWEIYVTPAGAPAPTQNTQAIYATVNPFVVTGLSCGNAYDVYVRSACGDVITSGWSTPTVVEMPCLPESGFPVNLEACSDTNQACFDLTQNDANVLGTLDPANYTVTYYATEADAGAGTNPITNPGAYCVTQPGFNSIVVFTRLEDNDNGTYSVFEFALTVRQVEVANFTPTPMTDCDSNSDGIVIFDLTAVASQLNTSNPLTYYTNSLDATSVSGANALTSPQAFPMSVSQGSQAMTIFVRENIIGGCDIIYSLQLVASGNCDQANLCTSANSLCESLGVPFNNTYGAGAAMPGISYGCLFSQPNPTWFYMPISMAGNLTFFIEQYNLANTSMLDVDFICWGPFTNPVTPCNNPEFLNPVNTVACSYSASGTEWFTIPNAQPGQFYILMVTNFSNVPGLVTITQTNAGQPDAGEIDCSGLRMTAFLDTNANGTKDSGESNFLLGEFHYEKNNNGVVHNVTSGTGTTGIYDTNPASTYDISYTIDPSYSANYAVSPSSYDDVSVVAGGMAEYFFPVTVTQAYDDLTVAIIAGNAPMPGFTFTNTVRYSNQGSQVASGTLTFNKPAAVSIMSISEAGVTTNATGFTYNFTNLQPFETRDIVVTMQVPLIPTVTLGQVLVSTADIAPVAGDIIPENNSATSTQTIIGSYDPNDKMESRGSYVLFSSFGSEDYLYYTIRFENTGTAPAQDVRITDVLEGQLDETSVRMVASSHDYVMDRTGNTLNWTFEDIDLPYASADPEGAKGFVQFKVKPKPGFAVGDVIQNSAAIYFDFNPAIVTNMFETHFVNSLGAPVANLTSFAMYPNPTNGRVTVSLNNASETIGNISIYDMVGKKVMTTTSSAASETFDVSTLSNGIYFVEVITSGQTKTVKKLVIE